MKYLLLLSFLFLSACHKKEDQPQAVDSPLVLAVAPPIDTPVPPESVMLLCAGQSNMVGVGTQHYYPDDSLVDGGANRQGPCFAAASTLAHTGTPRHITTVNCAVGGARIETWKQGSANYNKCLSMIAEKPSMPIIGLLWYQGESDAVNLDTDTMTPWPQNFTAIVRAFQTDLKIPTLPVVYAQIGKYCDIPDMACGQPTIDHWAQFQEVQLEAQSPGISMIMVKDLPTVDGVHHTDSTYWEIGRRFAVNLL